MTFRPIKSKECLFCHHWKNYVSSDLPTVDCLLECEGKGQQTLVGEATK